MKNVLEKSKKDNYPPLLLCDFYKVSHFSMYPENTQYIYSNLVPRSNKHLVNAKGAVVFGVQYVVVKYLINYFNENFFNRDKKEILENYKRYLIHSLSIPKKELKVSHIEELHDLQYLPIKVTAAKEGTLIPIGVPILTIENTHPKFAWLTNTLETLISAEIWKPITSASIALIYRKILEKRALQTTDNNDFVKFQAHDFSLRGMSGMEAGAISGAGHLTSFLGTDTIPAIGLLERYYNANMEEELIGTSIKATEHSIMCSLTPADSDRDEYEAFKYLLDKNPEGFLSIVSDTYNFKKVILETLPKLKNKIMKRKGKLVIRPDSGDPVDVLVGDKVFYKLNNDFTTKDVSDLFVEKVLKVNKNYNSVTGINTFHITTDESLKENKYYNYVFAVTAFSFNANNEPDYNYKLIETTKEEITFENIGLVETLYNIFGGTVNSKGYKELDSHIGVIYGDSINIKRASQILQRLKNKGFASNNVVLGIGLSNGSVIW